MLSAYDKIRDVKENLIMGISSSASARFHGKIKSIPMNGLIQLQATEDMLFNIVPAYKQLQSVPFLFLSYLTTVSSLTSGAHATSHVLSNPSRMYHSYSKNSR